MTDELETLRAERDAAFDVRDEAIRLMAQASREAGSWRGIAEAKDDIIRNLEREIGRLKVAIRVNFLRQGATDAEIDEVLQGGNP
jgi:hypothetical protein